MKHGIQIKKKRSYSSNDPQVLVDNLVEVSTRDFGSIGIRDKILTVEVQNELLYFPIPKMTYAQANNLLERLAPLAQRIVDGSHWKYDRNYNEIVTLDDDALAASEEISKICKEVG